jgi:hypothetical protein
MRTWKRSQMPNKVSPYSTSYTIGTEEDDAALAAQLTQL